MNAERPATESIPTFDDLFALIPPGQTNRTLEIMGTKLLLTSSPNALDIRLAETAMRLAAWAFDTHEDGKLIRRVMKGDFDTKQHPSFAPQISTFFRASHFLPHAVEHFDKTNRVTDFESMWIGGDNYEQYYAAIDQGASPEKAASTTWTARNLARLGFSPYPDYVKILRGTYEPVTHKGSIIEARFPRLQ